MPVLRSTFAAAVLLVIPLPSQRVGLVFRADLIQPAIESIIVERAAAVAWTIMSLASRFSFEFKESESPLVRSSNPEPGMLSVVAPVRFTDLKVCEAARFTTAALEMFR